MIYVTQPGKNEVVSTFILDTFTGGYAYEALYMYFPYKCVLNQSRYLLDLMLPL